MAGEGHCGAMAKMTDVEYISRFDVVEDVFFYKLGGWL
jgi:hypothetical protein